jgi:hypothetical protein
MKISLLFISFFLLLTGCKKAIENAQENYVIKAMTDGQWRMTNFTKSGTDITADFAPYRFQFRTNNTVDAINNGTTEKTGTWSADASAHTITSSFSNIGAPVALLNGTWKITKNSWTFVEATQTVSGEILTLRLDK